MTPADSIDFARSSILVLLEVITPTMLTALVVGLGIGLLQALTQIQEQTLSFAIKLIAVFATILLTARWLSGELYNFTLSVFDLLYKIR